MQSESGWAIPKRVGVLYLIVAFKFFPNFYSRFAFCSKVLSDFVVGWRLHQLDHAFIRIPAWIFFRNLPWWVLLLANFLLCGCRFALFLYFEYRDLEIKEQNFVNLISLFLSFVDSLVNFFSLKGITLNSDLLNFSCKFLFDCAAAKEGTWFCVAGFSVKNKVCRLCSWLHMGSSLFSWRLS